MKVHKRNNGIKILEFPAGCVLARNGKMVNSNSSRYQRLSIVKEASKTYKFINFQEYVEEVKKNYLDILVTSAEMETIEKFKNVVVRSLKLEGRNIHVFKPNNKYPQFKVVYIHIINTRFFIIFRKLTITTANTVSLFETDFQYLNGTESELRLSADEPDYIYNEDEVRAILPSVNHESFMSKFFPNFKIDKNTFEMSRLTPRYDEEYWNITLATTREIISKKAYTVRIFKGEPQKFEFPLLHTCHSYIHQFLSFIYLHIRLIGRSGDISNNAAIKYFKQVIVSDDGSLFIHSVLYFFYYMKDDIIIEKNPAAIRHCLDPILFIFRLCVINDEPTTKSLLLDDIGSVFYGSLLKLYKNARNLEFTLARQKQCSYDWNSDVATIDTQIISLINVKECYISITKRLDELCVEFPIYEIEAHIELFFSSLQKYNLSVLWGKYCKAIPLSNQQIPVIHEFLSLLVSLIAMSSPYPPRSSFLATLSLSNIIAHKRDAFHLAISFEYNRKSKSSFYSTLYLFGYTSKILAIWILILKPSLLKKKVLDICKKQNKDISAKDIPFIISKQAKSYIGSSSTLDGNKTPSKYYKEIIFATFQDMNLVLPDSTTISKVLKKYSDDILHGSRFMRQIFPVFGVAVMSKYPTAILAACSTHSLIQHGLGHTQGIAVNYYSGDGNRQFLVSKRRFSEICFIWCCYLQGCTFKIPILNLLDNEKEKDEEENK